MKAHKIILAGGSGFIGQLLSAHWKNTDTELIILSRQPHPNHNNVRYVVWDGETLGDWVNEVDNTDVLINLTGKSVDCRYTERNKQLIISSRINSTKVLGEAIQQSKNPPVLWINSSSATIYRHSLDKPMDENTGEIGGDKLQYTFSEDVCQAWENAFWKAEIPTHVRRVALRMAIVLGRQGGVFPVLKRLVHFGLGGQMGQGNQFMSWLHEQDLNNIIDFIIQNDTITGTYNCSAPYPIRNKTFMQTLRKSMGAKFGLTSTEWMLTIGAFFLRTEPELVLKSRNLVPKKLLNSGFRFQFPTAQEAFLDLIAKYHSV
ncbi:TIGR01777 family oxidoreductase [Spirosoma flavus]